MTPFCPEVKKRGIIHFLTKYSYLLITCTIVLPFSFFGGDGSVAKVTAALFLMTFGGMVMRGIMNYKEARLMISSRAKHRNLWIRTRGRRFHPCSRSGIVRP